MALTDLRTVFVDSILDRIAGKTVGSEAPRATDRFASGMTSNPALWCADLDFSGVPISGPWWAAGCGTVISPYHAITVWHLVRDGYISGTVTYRGTDGEDYAATILDHSPDLDSVQETSVLLFAEPLPAAVSPFPILGVSAYQRLTGCGRRLPVTSFHHYYTGDETTNKTNIGIRQAGTVIGRPRSQTCLFVGSHPDAADWYIADETGDSGHPRFVILDGQPVLIGVAGFPNSASSPGFALDELQAAMNALSDAHSLPRQSPVVADLTDYDRVTQPWYMRAAQCQA